jgi:multidrug efflux pump subunit AcrB
VANAVNAQNLTLPSGTAKIGDTQYTVRTNAVPATIDELNNIPVKFANGATVYVKDLGYVRDGSLVQQNVVRADGRRSVLLSVIKNGNASTVDVVRQVKEALNIARASAPPGMEIKELFDQSVFVSASVDSVLREGAIAAGLTALMILLFLGSWRSTLVVMISIPLSVLSSLIVLYFLGDTLNTMTLGGLALAIGILVDDSTVTIENTHRLLTEEGQPLPQATLHGAAGIAVPTLVSTLAISCVFTSVVFLEGPAKYLFTPLGLAVVFAMLASYGLSRTLTPITIGCLRQRLSFLGQQAMPYRSAGPYSRSKRHRPDLSRGLATTAQRVVPGGRASAVGRDLLRSQNNLISSPCGQGRLLVQGGCRSPAGAVNIATN